MSFQVGGGGVVIETTILQSCTNAISKVGGKTCLKLKNPFRILSNAKKSGSPLKSFSYSLPVNSLPLATDN